jgi:thiamine transport system substrate-binding protein
MRNIAIPILSASILGFAAPAAAQEKLTIYTYDSFVSEWGPGPAVG